MVNIQNNRNMGRGSFRRNDGNYSHRSTPRGEGNKVYVSNIDFACTHQELKEIFKEVGEVAFVEILRDGNQKSRGCAIVRFKENNMVDDAIRIMNRYELNGRKLVVKDERDAPKDIKSRDRKRPREDEYDRASSSGLDKFGNTYGLSLQFLESLGIDGPLVNRVFVANLDYSVDEDTVKELFEISGKVTDVELVRGDDGKSKGFGFIEFDHPVEAVQAISMLHNQIYHERPISVQLTRKEKKKKDGMLKLPPGLKGIGLGLGINGAPLKDVARTIEAGNQTSLLGAMPSGNYLGSGMDHMSGLSQNMNPNLMGSMGTGMQSNHGNMQSNMGSAMCNNMTSDMNPSLGRAGMGLMGRGGMGLADGSGMSVGIGQSNLRNMADTSMHAATSSNFNNVVGNTSQRNVVQISNLPSDYSWKALQNLCLPFGDVRFAKMTSRNAGVVHFENEEAARSAVDMLDHQRFEGRLLETRLL